ncbi:hypothetical protein NKG94_00990 [Micromonospora sp. M12]
MPRMSGDPEQARRLRSVPPDTATPPNADELLPRVARVTRRRSPRCTTPW